MTPLQSERWALIEPLLQKGLTPYAAGKELKLCLNQVTRTMKAAGAVKGDLKPAPRGVTKRLFFDIETTPNIGLFWQSGWKKTIGEHCIMVERQVCCISWKWEGEDEVLSLWWEDKCDKKMLERFIPLLESADEVVAHNSDRFDIPWLRGRCLIQDVPMSPTIRSNDTLKGARSKFKLNSNKLDYISKVTGGTGKEKTEFDWWKRIVWDDDQEALQLMVHYCEKDVTELERVYHKMKPYLTPKTHEGVIAGGEKYSCPNCGSTKITNSGTTVTTKGTIQRKMKCDNGHSYEITNKQYQLFVTDRLEGRI